MKKTITKEIEACDFCSGDKEAYHTCMKCGKKACYNCNEHRFKKLKHAVNFQGSMDGTYCHNCFSELLESKDNELFNAYLKLQSLIEEYNTFYSPWKTRSRRAERDIEFIWNNRKNSTN